jgi:hypothetical protein
VRGLVGHRRDDRHCGRARADHHDALPRVVERIRPELRVDQLALEAADARQAASCGSS